MRLRTEMVKGGIVAAGHTADPDNVEWYQSSAVCHDAALAHALTMALTESPFMSDMLVTIKVRKRAAEIMADWGYSDDGYSADIRIADMGGLPDGRR